MAQSTDADYGVNPNATQNKNPNGVTKPSELDVEKQNTIEQNRAVKESMFKRLGILVRFSSSTDISSHGNRYYPGHFQPQYLVQPCKKELWLEFPPPSLAADEVEAVGLLVMMYPILYKVRYESLHHLFQTRQTWVQIAFSVFANWVVVPLLMLALAWDFLSDEPELREGLILVLIWTVLSGGDGEYYAIPVAINSLLQMVLFAPLAILFINIIGNSGTHVALSYSTATASVAVFLGLPLAAAIVTRPPLHHPGAVCFAVSTGRSSDSFSGQSLGSLDCLFRRVAFFFATLSVTYKLRFGYKLSSTQSFTAASNNFELAIAVSVATFEPNSNQTLASSVGPLIEMQVLFGLVYVVTAMARRVGWED
ncbi:hypothetical protein ACJ72_06293 [Emergomyces africanus]|uniref:Arsenical-resistance protein n=1 Tax=Emergomyces africanus TaxID=1955775 RepID=A0A1B7NRN6_9EURO|nr:hypothetical protein ACJ72_06293 [Emergomyces africanus]